MRGERRVVHLYFDTWGDNILGQPRHTILLISTEREERERQDNSPHRTNKVPAKHF